MWRGGHCDKIIATGQLVLEPGHFVNKDINWNIWFFQWFNFCTYIVRKCGSNRSNDPLLYVASNIPNRRPLPEYAVRDIGLNIVKYCSPSNLFDIVSKYRQILFLRRGSPLCKPIYLCLYWPVHCARHQLFLVPCMYTITQFKYKYSGCMFLLEEELGYIHSMHPLRSLGTSSIRWISFSLSLLLNGEEMSYLRTLHFSLLLNRGGGIDVYRFEMALFIRKSVYNKFMTKSSQIFAIPTFGTIRHVIWQVGTKQSRALRGQERR